MAKTDTKSSLVQIAPRSIKNKIYLDFYVEGKRHKLHFGADDSVDNWHKASLMGYKIAADIANGSFDHSLKKYGKVAKPRYKSLIKNTIVNNQLDALDVFYKKFPIDISYRKILSKHCIKEWSNEWLVDLSYSAEYFNKLLRVLKKFEKFYLDAKYYDQPLYSIVSNRKKRFEDNLRRELRKPLAPEEIDRLLQFLLGEQDNPSDKVKNLKHYQDFILILLYCGLRIGECSAIRYCDVDFDKRIIRIAYNFAIQKDDYRQTIVRKSCKSNEIKYVKLPDILYSKLYQKSLQENPENLLFYSHTGKIITAKSFNVIWREILSICNIPYRVPYCLRHNFASYLLKNNVPAVDVAAMLGHTNINTLSKYYAWALNPPVNPEFK